MNKKVLPQPLSENDLNELVGGRNLVTDTAIRIVTDMGEIDGPNDGSHDTLEFSNSQGGSTVQFRDDANTNVSVSTDLNDNFTEMEWDNNNSGEQTIVQLNQGDSTISLLHTDATGTSELDFSEVSDISLSGHVDGSFDITFNTANATGEIAVAGDGGITTTTTTALNTIHTDIGDINLPDNTNVEMNPDSSSTFQFTDDANTLVTVNTDADNNLNGITWDSNGQQTILQLNKEDNSISLSHSDTVGMSEKIFSNVSDVTFNSNDNGSFDISFTEGNSNGLVQNLEIASDGSVVDSIGGTDISFRLDNNVIDIPVDHDLTLELPEDGYTIQKADNGNVIFSSVNSDGVTVSYEVNGNSVIQQVVWDNLVNNGLHKTLTINQGSKNSLEFFDSNGLVGTGVVDDDSFLISDNNIISPDANLSYELHLPVSFNGKGQAAFDENGDHVLPETETISPDGENLSPIFGDIS